MQFFLTSAALVASATVVFAAPAEIQERSTFSVTQVPRGKVLKSGPLAMMKTYNKYAKVGAVAPPEVRNAAAAAASQRGSVSANPTSGDESYLCPVTAGGQTLHLDFDTGSSDLWVFSTLQPSDENEGQDEYDPDSSSTSQELDGYTWQISYGDGSGASGVVYSDKVVVGGVTATSQAVEAATSVSSEFSDDTTTDGLLGLAFSSINTVQPQQQTTFFDTVSNSLASKLFTATLKKGQPGTYDFGYIDSSKYKGSIAYTSVDSSQGFWQFSAGSYATGSGSFSGSIGTAIADTGTTLLYVPSAAAKAYYSKVSGASYSSSQGGYIFPCSANLPNWSVKIGSGTFTVPGSYINFAPATGSSCFGGLQPNTGIGMSIFGDIFLKAVFAVFDKTQSSPRLGFAAQA